MKLKNPKITYTVGFVAIILLVVFIIVLAVKSNNKVTKTGVYFDTVISITVYDSHGDEYIDHCFEMADTYESYFSDTLEDSDVYEINHAGGASVTVHEETAQLITDALYYSKLSGGAFQITIGALTDLWDFSNNEGTIPDASSINEAVYTIDDNLITVTDNTVSLRNPATSIDLGAIAKGYIADRMKEYLVEQGVEHAIINLGGNVLCIGGNPNGDDFVVGIQKPFSEDGEAICTLEISDLSLVTSGTYQRYFTVDEVVYHHILDVNNGYPVNNGLTSVSILCSSSEQADALSTVCFLLGQEEGLALIESLDDVEAIFINSANEITTSSGLDGMLTVTDSEE